MGREVKFTLPEFGPLQLALLGVSTGAAGIGVLCQNLGGTLVAVGIGCALTALAWGIARTT